MLIMFTIPDEVRDSVVARTKFTPELFERAMRASCFAGLAIFYKRELPELYEWIGSKDVQDEIKSLNKALDDILK